MKRLGALFGVVTLVVYFALSASQVISNPADQDKTDLVEHGKYLVTLGGCNDCHSPKVMGAMGPVEDESRLLSGHPAAEPMTVPPAGVGSDNWMAACNNHMTAWAGPWGISYASNLTPDKKTGLGNWTEEQFVKALRTGKHRGFGRPILPPMPWPALAKINDEDLGAIFAYLMSLPPVDNKVPEPVAPTH
jgi:mono/diheme cytochrome c family protein